MADEQDIVALHGFIDETNESLQGIESAFVDLERDPGNPELINRIFRPVHSMKGNSGFFGLTNINKFAHRMEDLLDDIRKGELTVDNTVIDILLTGIDFLRQMLERVAADSGDVEMRREEEVFLVEKVEACRPKDVVGTLNSVLDLESLLHEAENVGVNLQEHSLTGKILDQVEKFNESIRTLLNERQNKLSDAVLYREDQIFRYGDQDYTAQVRQLAQAFNSLAGQEPLTVQQVKELKNSLHEIGTILAGRPGVKESIDELGRMVNFLDDLLMVASGEYCESTSKLLVDLIGFFDLPGQETVPVSRLGDILLEQGAVSRQQLDQAIGQQERLGQILKKQGVVGDQELRKALETQGRRALDSRLSGKATRLEKGKTIRIDQNKLDGFADTVGELFINVDSLKFIRNKLEEAKVESDTLTKFTNTTTSLDDMLSRLQEDVMSIRKVPVNKLFQRFPRVIRQIAATLDKQIDFRLIGQDTVIDKNLLEIIENPLVHILRNSADHGIERPEVRESKGKSAEGVLELAASVDEANVYLTIRDDGGGISPGKMKEIALEKGVMSVEEVECLTDDELVNLIFRAGFSSAKQVSDVSGRGVGMDAVMAGLNKCNGVIKVDSTVDTGTTVKITIPLTKTLVTKEALIVQTMGQLFAIPSEDITTIIFPGESMFKLLEGEAGLSYNGRVLKVIDANTFYYDAESDSNLNNSSARVVIVCEKYGVAIVMDKMFNHQQIVVKVFNKNFRYFAEIPGIYGFSIMGNEEIVLIVDVAKLVAQA